jgi:hypothetical protein
VSNPHEFWLHCDEIAALYRYLVDNDDLDATSVTDVAYFISKPWKWMAEYKAMVARRAINDADVLVGQLEASAEVADGKRAANANGARS